ncbi:MAG: glycosyltransferase family 2 protein [Gemmatimonas sp.]
MPTFQRAALLQVMLQALLPQAAEFGDQVEVCIADNASGDHTGQTVAEASSAYPTVRVNYLRRDENVGPVRNYVYCATQQATGGYVWALGDDDLLFPGALRRVMQALQQHRDIDFLYANFASASFESDWPASAVGGYVGSISDLACTYLQDRSVRYWQELVDSSSSMATQVYVHVVRRSVWTEFWHNRAISPDYRSVESTYPHTCMLIDKAWDKPAYYLGAPCLVQFNGRAGWADGNGTRIALVSLPQLVSRLDDRGFGLHALIRTREYLKSAALTGYRSVIAGKSGPDAAQVLSLSLSQSERYPEMVEAFLTALQESGGNVSADVIDIVRDALNQIEQRQNNSAGMA